MFFNVVLIFLAVLTRFWGLTWGSGFFFHPDENNMASALSQLSFTNLNPHFFAYGQFPLYLGYLSLQLFHLSNNFANSVFILRLWSAVFSLLSVFIFNKIFKNKIATLFFIFAPGLIQLAHFGTTESLLILVFLINLYISQKPPTLKNYLLAGIATGIGVATKISALIFVIPIILSLAFAFSRSKSKLRFFLYFLAFGFVLCALSLIFSPYNLIAKDDFLSSMHYETQVASGTLNVFYTTQFEHTFPYLFQFTHIFPYIAGLPMFTLFFLGLIHKSYTLNHKSKIIFISCLVYFLYFGQLYVKWTRFMSPLFFIFPLVAGYFISQFRNIYLKSFLILICVFPGIYFMKLYFSPDIRVVATNWMAANLPQPSVVMSESGNVINLPPSQIYFDFYSHDYSQLPFDLASADYVLIPSRRVFKNGIAPQYYQNLFNGRLGFQLLKEFSPDTDLVLNPENAEETWTVFDRPTLRLYKKINQLSPSDYAAILKS